MILPVPVDTIERWKMKSKSMHKTAMVGKKHGTPMSKGTHQVPPMAKKTRGDRKGTAKGGKLTAL
jgi:hypothetical protein